MSAARARWLLLLIAVAALACDLWAVFSDQRFRGTDSIVLSQLAYFEEPDLLGWLQQIVSSKGVVGPLLALPFTLLVHSLPEGPRVLCALAHGVLVAQAFHLARQLGGRVQSALWAAAITATMPLVYGLCRLAFHDVVAAVMLCATLELALWAEPHRPRRLVALGAVLGAGLLTKLSFALLAAGPMLWFAARHLRSPRSALRLLLVPLTTVALVTPLAIASWAQLAASTRASLWAGEQMALVEKLRYYASLPGVVPLVLLALLALLVLALTRRLGRWQWLLAATSLLMLLGVLLPNPWARFLLPVAPLLAVLVAMLLDELLGRLWRWLRWGVGGAVGVGLGLLLLLPTVGQWDLVGIEQRELQLGMTTPDRRPYTGFPRAVTTARRLGDNAQLVFDSVSAQIYMQHVPDLWQHRGAALHWIPPHRTHKRIEAGIPTTVFLVRQFPNHPLDLGVSPQALRTTAQTVDELWRRPTPESVELQRSFTLCMVERWRDPDGIEYWILRAKLGRCPGGFAPVPPDRPMPPRWHNGPQGPRRSAR